ncbi:hypothetical protein HDU76_004262 [Blyttiomyces sp. JEL0837]|nr:hypothetical protein HDU76_004262 [Blyttiomyces sp. JEL0837]
MNRSINRRGQPPRQAATAPTTSRKTSTAATNTGRQQQQLSTIGTKKAGAPTAAAATPALNDPIGNNIDQRDHTQRGSSSTATETSVKEVPPLPNKPRSVTTQTDRDAIITENEKLKADLEAMKKLLAEKDKTIEELKGEVREQKRDVPKNTVSPIAYSVSDKLTVTSPIERTDNDAWPSLQDQHKSPTRPNVSSVSPTTGNSADSGRQPNGVKLAAPKKGKAKFVPLATFESNAAKNSKTEPMTSKSQHRNSPQMRQRSPQQQQQQQQQQHHQQHQSRPQSRPMGSTAPRQNNNGQVPKQEVEATVAENGVLPVPKYRDLKDKFWYTHSGQQQQPFTQAGTPPAVAPTPALNALIGNAIDHTQRPSSSTSTSETSVKASRLFTRAGEDVPLLPKKARSVPTQTDRDNIISENEKLKADLEAMKTLLAEKDRTIEGLKGQVRILKGDVPKTGAPKKDSTRTVSTSVTELNKSGVKLAAPTIPTIPAIPTIPTTTAVQPLSNDVWPSLQGQQNVSPRSTVISSSPTASSRNSTRQLNGAKSPAQKKGKPKFVPLATFEKYDV